MRWRFEGGAWDRYERRNQMAEMETLDEKIMRHAAELLAKSTPRQMSQAVQEVVKKNEDWRGKQCINLLALEEHPL
jgi:hypothetical protein